MINIYLNGDPREVPDNLTLAALLEWLNLPADRVAVERNREIASRLGWDKTVVQAGDRLEVVHFVGGGVDLVAEPIAHGLQNVRCPLGCWMSAQ